MKVERVETFSHNKLEMEYNKLIEGLKTKGVITEKQSADSSKTVLLTFFIIHIFNKILYLF